MAFWEESVQGPHRGQGLALVGLSLVLVEILSLHENLEGGCTALCVHEIHIPAHAADRLSVLRVMQDL